VKLFLGLLLTGKGRNRYEGSERYPLTTGFAMHRLDRRLRILRGKKNTPFNSRQYAVERATRARAARRVRHLLRRMVPVVLHTPRWSEARAFLDDVSVDLGVRKPIVQCRTLAMTPMAGRTVHDSRQYLSRAVIEFCELYVPGPVWMAVDRNGFRNVMRDLLRRARTGPQRALLVHGLENLHREAVEDFVHVFSEHVEEFTEDRRLNILLAGTQASMSQMVIPGSQTVHLADFSEEEAVEALVEYLGPTDKSLLKAATDLVGGVPTLVDAVGRTAASGQWLTSSKAELLRGLGRLGDEVRTAVEILCADGTISARLEEVAMRGSAVREPVDERLVTAGLFRESRHKGELKVHLRAKVFAQ
jgi:hypothetical protein